MANLNLKFTQTLPGVLHIILNSTKREREREKETGGERERKRENIFNIKAEQVSTESDAVRAKKKEETKRERE